jgi:AAA domain
MSSTFTFRPARRENVPLLIGMAGGTGSGKTMSALALARGLAGDAPFAVIDTENGRAKHYADMFQPWHHGDLATPFTPAHYSEAIKAADAEGYRVIVVDSASHEWAGEGGLLDWHETELDRLAGDNAQRRETMTFTAWVKPKMQHKRYVNELLQVRAHVILCFRAEEKIDIVKEGGKTKVVPKQSRIGLGGWVPVCEKTLPFELTASLLFTADEPGVPKPIKLQEQHRELIPPDKPIGEDTGKRLAEWALGTGRAAAAPDVDALTQELLGLSDRLDVRELVVAKMDENRTDHADNPRAHARWLQAQIGNAQTALAQQESTENLFEAANGNGAEREPQPA